MPNDTRAILKGLRSAFDGSSVFMSGHQILRKRTLSKRRRVPEWAKQDEFIRELLLRSFPYLHTNLNQRKKAGRWARVIQSYFREQHSYKETAEEIGETPRTTEMLIRAITRAVNGKKANGSGSRRCRKPNL